MRWRAGMSDSAGRGGVWKGLGLTIDPETQADCGDPGAQPHCLLCFLPFVGLCQHPAKETNLFLLPVSRSLRLSLAQEALEVQARVFSCSHPQTLRWQ